jgi:hypothetical protein
MAAVVTYWQLPEDEKDFLSFLQGTGNVLALPDRWVSSREELAPRPIPAFVDQYDPNQLLFGLDSHVTTLRIEEHRVDGAPRFALPHMEPCVIAYGRGRLCDGKLAQSNLSAYWSYPSRVGLGLVKKDPEFVAWARHVMGWVRRATPKRLICNGYPYRATSRAANEVAGGRVQLVLY